MQRMDEGLAFLLQYENVAWYQDGKVKILDRRVYPREIKFVICTNYLEVRQAIADMLPKPFPYQQLYKVLHFELPYQQ